jgi:hypothetical protein
MKIKQQLTNSQHVGTYAGDWLIEEAENDPNIVFAEDKGNSEEENSAS